MTRRLHLVTRGAVQGVGFRPFVYRLATDMCLPGWVSNSPQGVYVEVEGEQDLLERFLDRFQEEKPPRSFIQSFEYSYLDPIGLEGFEIRESDATGDTTTLVLPDIATCPQCLDEIFDRDNRRYLYPFTNCTNCGPRFTIIESLPYDRPNTTMRGFEMCPACRREYEDPQDRRFHAQPNACPLCGPALERWDSGGVKSARFGAALLQVAEEIRAGRIVAVKGLGGFHLMVDAHNDAAVSRLRARKHREEKPLAVMFPSLSSVLQRCQVSELERRLLLSPESPIVLLSRRSRNLLRSEGAPGFELAPSVAPGNPYLGVMLPYTPLHHILMREIGFPVVATSGNLSDEPICTDEGEALERLGGIADSFLVHNRPIVRHVDDSIVRVTLGRELVLRRARGYAPLPVRIKHPAPELLAVGGHLKNTVAITAGQNVFLSQHIGDLETEQAYQAFEHVIDSFQRLYERRPEIIACDFHPDYLSSGFARASGRQTMKVQHHFAHVASCMAENELEGRVLGVSWDGTGYGPDGTIWGGEFLLTLDGPPAPGLPPYQRVATLRSFRLPGGAKAVKEPRRTALGMLYEIFGKDVFACREQPPQSAFSAADLDILRQALDRGLNAPVTTSAGRLFDGVASLLGLRQEANFEGQAAMELEFLAESVRTRDGYAYGISDFGFKPDWKPRSRPASGPVDGPAACFVDWAPMILSILEDRQSGVSKAIMAAKFHNTLTEIIVDVAQRVGVERIVLTGGCFQNRYLSERTVNRLEATGFKPYWHQRVPPNDGGIALGQIYAAVLMGGRHNQAASTNGVGSRLTVLPSEVLS